MPNDLDIDSLDAKEIESAKQVIDVERKDRQGETINEAFINRIKETIEIGNTGYKREVVFPIPLELIQENEGVKDFISNVGKISRDKELGLPILMEEESVEDIKIINLVFEPTEYTKVDRIEEILNK